MNKTLQTRSSTRWLAVVAIAGGALILGGCQTSVQTPGTHPTSVPRHGPVDQRYIDEYAGRPADRVAEEVQRRVDAGQLPSSACLQNVIVEHPDGGYYLVCTIPATAP